ncbi:MAG: TfoX/Sxy family protein [Hungateiclostridium thermocellum]|nr:TfoX/Sxy family protein [Acetivibrio thermocellus]
MEKLSGLPNIGRELERRLNKAGINDAETLIQTGSRETFTKLRLLEGDTCFNTLCALEGAVKGIRWHYLDSETKAELKSFFESIKQHS